MEKWELIAPCHFGMEAILKREIQNLGYEITRVEDGKVTFEADARGIAEANMFLRTTERILLKVGKFVRKLLKNCLTGPESFPGKISFPETGNSGWQRPIL